MTSALGVLLAVSFLPTARPGPAEEPTPSEILARVKAIGEPAFDPARKDEPVYVANYKRQQHILYREKAGLLLDLCRMYPEDERVPRWMNRRWELLRWNQNPIDVAEEVLADIASTTANVKNKQVLTHAAYWRAYFQAHTRRGNARGMLESIEPFLAGYPEDQRGAELIALVAFDDSADSKIKIAMHRRLADRFPDTHDGTYAPGRIRCLQSLGQPFALSFDDVVTGRRISMADLRGKVVVIDFWSTTCVPCLAEMPHLKVLYAKYHERGLEFIGVCLDESEDMGGLTALRRYIKKQEIPWPQFYQGDGYDSAFSKSWGIGSAPSMFVLDRRGRLRSVDAVGKLDELIPALLAE